MRASIVPSSSFADHAALAAAGDIPADTTTPATLALGETFTGTLETVGDRDWIRVTLEAGQFYRIAMSGAGDTPVEDTYLRLYDATGTLVTTDDDSGPDTDALLAFSPTTTGTYYVAAGSYDDSETGGYSLTMTATPVIVDGVPADTSTGASVTVGGTYSGVIDGEGDRDWIRVELVEGQTYRIELNGAETSTLSDPFLNLYDATGTLVAWDDDSGPGTDSLLVFTATGTGPFYIGAGAYGDLGAGAYTVSVTETAAPVDLPADTTTPVTLSIAGSYTGSLETPGDQDWIRVELVAGQFYRISLEGAGASPMSDPFLSLFDADGTLIASNDDGGDGFNALLGFTPTVSGTYYLGVGSAADTDTGSYEISLETATLVEFTPDQIADQLIHGYWDGESRRFDLTAGRTITVNYADLTSPGQSLAQAALQTWADVTGITFQTVAGEAQITFDDADDGAYANSTVIDGIILSSSVNVGLDWLESYGTELNGYAFQTYVHEIGHALGLGHAGNYNGNASYDTDAHYVNDSWQASIMSYFNQVENTFINATEAFVLTPQLADILAVHLLYGTPAGTRTGNTIYGFNTNAGSLYDFSLYDSPVSLTLYDTGGVDTLDLSGFSDDQSVFLIGEAVSDVGGAVGNLIIARDVVIERAIGGRGADAITANAAANLVDGRLGNDSIDGAAGNDSLIGGHGHDRLLGGSGSDRLDGNDGNDLLFGEDGDDRLFGGNANDSLVGGAGNDRLLGGNGHDRLDGNVGDDVLEGEAGSDRLFGGSGNDILTGGQGRDQLSGGSGADIFVFTRASDSGTGPDSWDVITDFLSGEDRIDLTRLDADTGLAGINRFTTLLGAGDAFTAAGQLRFVDGVLYGNTDADADAEFAIHLGAGARLVVSDLLL